MIANTPTKAEIELSISMEDRIWRIENHLWIKNKEGQIAPFRPLRKSQLKILNLIVHLRKHNQPVRIMVLKSRQTGISTAVEADMYLEVIDRGIDGMVIAHKEKTASKIHRMTKLFHEKYDLPKPTLRTSNREELSFIGHHGVLDVETANNKFAGTGVTPQYIHSTEEPKWAKGDETAISLFQGLAYKPGTALVREATANSFDPLFHPAWEDAVAGCRVDFDKNQKPIITMLDQTRWNYFYPVFIPVTDDPDCFLPFNSESAKAVFADTLDEEEKFILKQVPNANLEYINFRRFCIKNRCAGSVDTYHQEYPETPEQAFLMSGRPRFDRKALLLMPIERGETGRLDRKEQGWEKFIYFKDDPGEFLTVFRRPEPGHDYVAATDVSEGLVPEGCKDPDSTVTTVWDITGGGMGQAATLDGPISEEQLPAYLDILGRWYNMAFQVIEINAGGIAVPPKLVNEFGYPPDRIFHKNDWQETGSGGEMGWKTTTNTRHFLIQDLADFIREMEMEIRDVRTQKECMAFVRKDRGRVEAQTGSHDDHVLSGGLGIQGKKAYPKYNSQGYMAQRNNRQRMARKGQTQSTADDVTGY